MTLCPGLPTGFTAAGDAQRTWVGKRRCKRSDRREKRIGRDRDCGRGLFIAVTNGPHPRDAVEDVAILYGDGWTSRVTAYQYDDVLNHQSWSDPNGFLESFEDAVSFELQPDGSLALSLSINAAGINAFDGGPDWAGVQFGPTIGVLSAALENDETQYGPNGELLDFDFGARTSYDRFARATTPMPEPNALVLFAAGAFVVGFATRRQRG